MTLEIQVDVSGFDDVIASEPGRVQDWLDGFTEDLNGRIVQSFGTSPAGRTYVRGGVSHVASQPGYPPNVDTGALRSSITWEQSDALENTIYVGAEHGENLEDGTEDIEPRPFMAPAFNDAGERFEGDAADNLRLED